MTSAHAAISLIARILLSVIFIQSGWGKISGYAETAGYMQSHGVPGMLLPAVIALELGAGLAILLGIYARWAGLGLALFTLAAAGMFHYVPGDKGQMINFMKNVTMAGGLLLLFANGPGRWAIKD